MRADIFPAVVSGTMVMCLVKWLVRASAICSLSMHRWKYFSRNCIHKLFGSFCTLTDVCEVMLTHVTCEDTGIIGRQFHKRWRSPNKKSAVKKYLDFFLLVTFTKIYKYCWSHTEKFRFSIKECSTTFIWSLSPNNHLSFFDKSAWFFAFIHLLPKIDLVCHFGKVTVWNAIFATISQQKCREIIFRGLKFPVNLKRITLPTWVDFWGCVTKKVWPKRVWFVIHGIEMEFWSNKI